MKLALFLHVLGVVVWVGGMFFAYMALRPAAAKLLEPPQRLPLWRETLSIFFRWVWVAVILILLSGLYMLHRIGNFSGAPIYALVMAGVGLVMMLIFVHIFFAPFSRLKRFVDAQDWKSAGAALAQIRMLVGVNLSLGLAVIVITTLGTLSI